MTRRNFRLVALSAVVGVAILGSAGPQPLHAAGAQSAPPSQADEYRPLVNRYCVTCHNERLKVPSGSPLFLDKANLDDIAGDAAVWEKVVRKLGVGAMPPQGAPRPEPAALEQFSSWLTASLDSVAAAHPNPGRVLVHRLNRSEYGNAVRDLLGLQVDVTSMLPPDSASYGFDNIADILKVSPALLESYLTAAMKVSSLAVGDTEIESVVDKFPVSPQLSQDERMDGLPFGTRGGVLVNYYFPVDADYQLAAWLVRAYNNCDRGLEGQTVPQDFIITVDGVRVHHVQLGGVEGDQHCWADFTAYREAVRASMQVRVPIKAGPHAVGFTFLMKSRAGTEELLKPFVRTSQDGAQGGGLPALESVFVTGPLNPSGAGDTPSRRRIFVCRPGGTGKDEACAKDVLSTLARRAYRRPLTEFERERLMKFYREGRAGGTFDKGVQSALSYILSNPSFLFRAETGGIGAAGNALSRVSDLDLASRLSFFLWSSIPDDELVDLAVRSKLHEPDVLKRQIHRMLADERSAALVTNFAGQWLQLRNLGNISRDLLEFPDFDDNLRDAFRRETELLFESVIREDRNVLDLLNADYTFLNERLAKHYGIEGVYGTAFRRVTLTDPNRRGLLGQGSILAMTAHPKGSTPTIRGKWILANLLSTPPLPPPPNVPAIATNTAADAAPRTLRERMEDHRKNAVCASCHKVLDPPGFALENFGALGEWRATDAGKPVDASGVLVDGTQVNGPAALREALMKRPNVFVGTMVERLMIYGLGRGLEPYDMPSVRTITREAARSNYRFSGIIEAIANTTAFQMRSGAVEAAAAPVGATASSQK